jgi:hypothetical protein
MPRLQSDHPPYLYYCLSRLLYDPFPSLYIFTHNPLPKINTFLSSRQFVPFLQPFPTLSV